MVPATVVIPMGKGPFPVVVMNNDHGGSRQENGEFHNPSINFPDNIPLRDVLGGVFNINQENLTT